MTTTTTVTDRLEEFEATAREAEAEVAEIRRRREERGGRIAHLRGERLHLAREEPAQFDKDGRPKKGSEAAKVVAEVERLAEGDLGPMLAGAEERAKRARRAVTDFMAEHPTELAQELRPDAEAIHARIRRGMEEVIRGIEEQFQLEQRVTQLLGPVSGLDGSDLPNSDRLSHLRQFLLRELNADYPLALPRSLVPQKGYPPRRVPGPHGWVHRRRERQPGRPCGVHARGAAEHDRRHVQAARQHRPGHSDAHVSLGESPMSADDIQEQIGLPRDLEAEQAAQALERAARDIRLGDSAEADLIRAIEEQQAAKRDDELIRVLSCGGEGDDQAS